MFGIADYWAFVIAVIVFLAIPGPGNLAIITSTSKGRIAGGLAATAGVIAGDQVLMWLAVAGVAALLTSNPSVFSLVQYAGAIYLAYLGVRFPSWSSRLLERTAYLGYATPPLALALAFVFFSLQTLPLLYQTLTLLVIALALHFLAEAIGPIRAALHQVPVRLEEAARGLGISPGAAFVRVTLPLVWRGVVSSLALVFLSSLKELPISFLLSPVGFDTLAKRIWGYTSEAMFAEAAPYALCIVLISSVLAGMVLVRGRQ